MHYIVYDEKQADQKWQELASEMAAIKTRQNDGDLPDELLWIYYTQKSEGEERANHLRHADVVYGTVKMTPCEYPSSAGRINEKFDELNDNKFLLPRTTCTTRESIIEIANLDEPTKEQLIQHLTTPDFRDRKNAEIQTESFLQTARKVAECLIKHPQAKFVMCDYHDFYFTSYESIEAHQERLDKLNQTYFNGKTGDIINAKLQFPNMDHRVMAAESKRDAQKPKINQPIQTKTKNKHTGPLVILIIAIISIIVILL